MHSIFVHIKKHSPLQYCKQLFGHVCQSWFTANTLAFSCFQWTIQNMFGMYSNSSASSLLPTPRFYGICKANIRFIDFMSIVANALQYLHYSKCIEVATSDSVWVIIECQYFVAHTQCCAQTLNISKIANYIANILICHQLSNNINSDYQLNWY